MPESTPIPEPCDDMLEDFHYQPIADGCPPGDTPLMKAYREEIDLIADYGLAARYRSNPSDLLWALLGAFAAVVSK